MAGMWSGILRGAVAGAAGTTALNAATYIDMAVRGRPASSAADQTVQVLADRAGLSIPGPADERANRVTGLGALAGIATGISVGAVFGALRHAGLRPPPAVGAMLAAAGAMGATDLSMAGLGVSDPRNWSVADWASDLVPHLVYGAVVAGTLAALDRHG
jgi:hypothetical protein